MATLRAANERRCEVNLDSVVTDFSGKLDLQRQPLTRADVEAVAQRAFDGIGKMDDLVPLGNDRCPDAYWVRVPRRPHEVRCD